MELIPLGTSSASIVRDRGLTAYVLRNQGKVFLFDCGEGTQFRLLKAGIRRSRIRAIFITHLHADHYFGLFGLLISMSLERRKSPLTIIAPRELSDILQSFSGLRPADLPFEIKHIPLEEGLEFQEVYAADGIQVSARPLAHGRFCMGYRVERVDQVHRIDGALAALLGITAKEQFQRLAAGQSVQTSNGQVVAPDQVRKSSSAVFAYVTDTSPCPGGLELARNADLLVHEATFGQERADRARETGHSTASDAALTARNAGAGRLLLTHFSARYKDLSVLEKEAKAIFLNTEIAEENQVYPITSRRDIPRTDPAA